MDFSNAFPMEFPFAFPMWFPLGFPIWFTLWFPIGFPIGFPSASPLGSLLDSYWVRIGFLLGFRLGATWVFYCFPVAFPIGCILGSPVGFLSGFLLCSFRVPDGVWFVACTLSVFAFCMYPVVFTSQLSAFAFSFFWSHSLAFNFQFSTLRPYFLVLSLQSFFASVDLVFQICMQRT